MNQTSVREILPARLDGNDKVGHFKTAVVCLLADMFLDSIFNIGWHPNLPCFGLHFGSGLRVHKLDGFWGKLHQTTQFSCSWCSVTKPAYN